jgi:hypothetical protein
MTETPIVSIFPFKSYLYLQDISNGIVEPKRRKIISLSGTTLLTITNLGMFPLPENYLSPLKQRTICIQQDK